MPPQAVLLGIVTIPGKPALLRTAREFVAHTLGDGCSCKETAVLLTSELVTNSIQHSNSRHPGGTISIAVITADGSIRVEVVDDGGQTVPAIKTANGEGADLAEDGRGLQMVELLSARWSHYNDEDLTVTWFELDEPTTE
jgi:anti-sigma regulatory factor (Ser/Thr protein kinase)